MAAVGRLSSVLFRLKSDFNLSPVMATEIEFYAPGLTQKLGKEAAVELIRQAVVTSGLPLAKAEAETGEDQFEISLLPLRDVALLGEYTEQIKRMIQDVMAKYDTAADFSAKPFANRPGSGLHVHFHLEDAAGNNRFTRDGTHMEAHFSDTLLHSVGGLLEFMNPCMKYFAPHEASYARFACHSNAPATVSWGTNNRTVAIRLPAKAIDNKHIEHRVAAADAIVADVLWAVLVGAHHGLAQKCQPPQPVYGNASLPQYALPPLAGSLEEAEAARASCKALQTYI